MARSMRFSNNRPKIAFLTSLDPKDQKSWSGTYYFLAKALQKHCGDVSFLGPVNSPKMETKIVELCEKFSRKILKKNYNSQHSFLLSRGYAKIFEQKLLEESFDFIFVPSGSTEVAFIKTKIPIIYLCDTTFALHNNYYPNFSNFVNVFEGNIIEETAIKKAALLLYSSEWAANSALKDYHANPAKIHIVPLGANLNNIPCKEAVLEKKKSDKCRLLFLGVDWKRKGGEIAFETLLRLEEFGLQTELIVCGCIPPSEFSHRSMKTIPFLDKNDQAQSKKLDELLFSSDFLLLPTRRECYGIVFCEASAFGLPVITTNTGGVSGAVKDGENGFMLPISAGGADYAEVIYKLYQDEQRYFELVKSSRKAFEERLNWDAWAISVKKLLSSLSKNAYVQ